MNPIRLTVTLCASSTADRSTSILARSRAEAEKARAAAEVWGLRLADEQTLAPGTRLFSVKVFSDGARVHDLRDLEEVQDIVESVIPPESAHHERLHEFLANGGERFEANSKAYGFDVAISFQAIA